MKKRFLYSAVFACLTVTGLFGCRNSAGGGQVSESSPSFVSIPSLSSGSVLSSQSTELPKSSSVPEPVQSVSTGSSALSEPEMYNGLPRLIVGQKYMFGGGSGEDYCVTGIEELDNANPWTRDAELKTLPVYQNVYVSSEEIPKSVRMTEGLVGRKASPEEMEAAVCQAAQDLGLTEEPFSENVPNSQSGISKVYLNRTPDKAVLSYNNGETSIEADTQLDIYINFKRGEEFPEEHTLEPGAPYDKQAERGEYLIEKYRKLLHMEKPALNIDGRSNVICAGVFSVCDIYEGAGELEQQLVNYHFNRGHFTCDADGLLSSIRLYRYDLSEKIGDYPIITPEEARKKLTAGNYIKGSAADFPGEEHIAKAELVYETDEVIWMPYYRFYAEISLDDISYPFETEEEKFAPDGRPLKAYAAFYVPAIADEYIAKMPDKEGRFDK